jgi:S-adenosylmethionine/arginine decarboxylase-like enzyme
MTLSRSLSGVLLVCGLVASIGCEQHALYAYRDEAYLVRYEERNADPRAMLRSFCRDEREIGLRLLAVMAREHVRAGESDAADAAVATLLTHYKKEFSPQVRSFLISVCLPEAGVRNDRVLGFLEDRLVEGNHTVDALHAMTRLYGKEQMERVASFLEHPRPEVRYAAAMAVSCCRDPGVVRALRNLAETMSPERWPSRVRGMTRTQCRQNLAARADALERSLEE